MVFNATSNNISVIWWWLVLSVEEYHEDCRRLYKYYKAWSPFFFPCLIFCLFLVSSHEYICVYVLWVSILTLHFYRFYYWILELRWIRSRALYSNYPEEYSQHKKLAWCTMCCKKYTAYSMWKINGFLTQ
jgi:hypothetical protein